MKKKDIWIAGIALLIAAGLYGISLIGWGRKVSTVVVTVNGEERLRKPLVVNASYEIEQEDGSRNVIHVENGVVRMEEANCRDGLCIRQGSMRNGAKTIVCLPHRVVVQLEGDTQVDDDLDVIVH